MGCLLAPYTFHHNRFSLSLIGRKAHTLPFFPLSFWSRSSEIWACSTVVFLDSVSIGIAARPFSHSSQSFSAFKIKISWTASTLSRIRAHFHASFPCLSTMHLRQIFQHCGLDRSWRKDTAAIFTLKNTKYNKTTNKPTKKHFAPLPSQKKTFKFRRVKTKLLIFWGNNMAATWKGFIEMIKRIKNPSYNVLTSLICERWVKDRNKSSPQP